MKKANRRAVFGILLIAIGTLILLDNLWIIDVPYYLFTWQMILVLIGGFQMLTGNVKGGLIVMGIGIFFWVINYQNLHLRDYWPIILIIIGISFFLRGRRRSRSESSEGATHVDDMAIFSSTNKKITGDKFSSGKITAVFGAIELDLRNCTLDNGKAEIDTFAAFGGFKIYVPDGWAVESEITNILGGYEDKRNNTSSGKAKNTLTLKGMILFGGGEIIS